MSEFDPFHAGPEELRRVMDQTERMMRDLAQAQEGLSEITGEGESEDGQVRALTDAGGQLDEIVFAPGATSMDVQTLAESVTEAIQRAQDDAELKTREL